MDPDFRKTVCRDGARHRGDGGGFDDLLRPARAFAHPSDVVDDSDLTLNEKRAILASWASDACAAEANPLLRRTCDGRTVSWDDVMDALKELDLQAANSPATSSRPELFRQPRRGLQRGSGGGSNRGSQPA
ncbi:hypothetical protein [Rhodoblastus sp.]|uniref:hypothetical protein n=1 Tax=Rhodoblastus sp. TaxID=1962975 RepID=UPI00260958AE|nr:hypothetical protein [Rhodoblastus sp.]